MSNFWKKLMPSFVFWVPCFVILTACSSKQIQNAAIEPLDLPAEESTYDDQATSTYEPLPATVAPARVKKAKKASYTKKKRMIAKKSFSNKKKKAAAAIAAVNPVNTPPPAPPAEELVIGQETLSLPDAPAPLTMGSIEQEMTETQSPRWGFAVAGVALFIGLIGLLFRMRRQAGKRGLVFN